MSNVSLRSLVKRFGETVAVDNVNLEIESGSFTTLLGPSGCGKTTSLRLISGFLEPDGGDILIGGRSLNGVPPDKRPTSIVFQDYAIFPHMTVFNNVAYGLRAQRVRRKEIDERVAATLDLLGMRGLDDRYANQLSGGQQQRVALARSLVLQPEVLLMDEPLSNLDAKLRGSVSREFKELQRKVGITTIYVTHDQTEALSMSNKIAVMNNGQVEQWGSPFEIYYEPKSKFVADFIGKANFVPAVVEDVREDQWVLRFGNQRRLTLKGNNGTAWTTGSDVVMMLRPEAIGIAEKGSGGGQVPAVVKERMFYGSNVSYWVEMDSEILVVHQEISPTSPIHQGEVELAFNPDWIKVFDPDIAADHG